MIRSGKWFGAIFAMCCEAQDRTEPMRSELPAQASKRKKQSH